MASTHGKCRQTRVSVDNATMKYHWKHELFLTWGNRFYLSIRLKVNFVVMKIRLQKVYDKCWCTN